MRAALIVTVAALALLGCNVTYTIPLQAGPNLGVVYPGETMPVEDAVASILPQLETVQYWNGSIWLVWTSDAAADTLSTMVHGEPYAIFLNEPAMWRGP